MEIYPVWNTEHREGLKVRVEQEHSEKFFKKPVSALNTKVTTEKTETTDKTFKPTVEYDPEYKFD